MGSKGLGVLSAFKGLIFLRPHTLVFRKCGEDWRTAAVPAPRATKGRLERAERSLQPLPRIGQCKWASPSFTSGVRSVDLIHPC